MQTKILFSLCVLFMSVVVSAQQSYNAVTNNTRSFNKEASFSFSVIPDKTTAAFGLHVYNPAKKKIDLQISHKANGMVVDTVITDVQFDCRYNFDQADDGLYIITLSCGKEKISKEVAISTVTTRSVVLE
jgi:hypothetical protein